MGREEKLNEIQMLINSNKFKEANELMDELRELDKKNANERALNTGNYKPFNIYQDTKENIDGTVIASTGNTGGENKVNNLFLNRNDKLADMINIVDEEEKRALNSNGALANVVKGMVTGQWDDKVLKNAVTTTSAGVLIPNILSAKIIDLAREKSLFGIAGVQTLPMESNNVTISRVKTDPVFKFKAEGTEAIESTFELDSIELKSKTCYGYAYVSLEAINSSKNLDQILYQVFSEAMAQSIDKGFLYGQNSEAHAPSGIMNDAQIGSIEHTGENIYDTIVKGIGKIKRANGEPTILGVNAATEELMSLMKDSTGLYLMPPKAVTNLNQIVSNQLKYDEMNGSDSLIFDPTALIIGIQNNIQIRIIEDTECLKKGLVGFQIYSMLDCKAVTPKNICKISKIK